MWSLYNLKSPYILLSIANLRQHLQVATTRFCVFIVNARNDTKETGWKGSKVPTVPTKQQEIKKFSTEQHRLHDAGRSQTCKNCQEQKQTALCIYFELGQIYKNDSVTLKLQKNNPCLEGQKFHVLARYWFPSNGGSSLLVALPRNVMENCLPQGVVSIFLSLG